MSNVKFVRQDEKKGKKYNQVAAMLQALKDAAGDPVPFEEMCEAAGAKYPQDVQAAFFALELAGIVDRYSYVEQGSTRSHVAYALAKDEEGNLADPS